MKKPSPLATKWPCLFSTKFAKPVDEVVDNRWTTAFGGRTPFGDLRQQWRRQHCRTLNPYGSDTCPYPMQSCADAFLDAVSITSRARPKIPVGYFRTVAKMEAARRADEKPLNRGLTSPNWHDKFIRTGVPNEEPKTQGSGDAGPQREGTESRHTDSRWVRSPLSRPVSIADVLGQTDPRPHPRSPHDGEEGTE